MQAFNIFQAGGKQKFLKKKKQKKAKTQEVNKQSSSVQMIQRNIQRFLQINRANLKYQNRLELQGEEQTRQDLWKYWLLTPYHIKTFGKGYQLINFWQKCVIGQNQVQSPSGALIDKMVKLTIEFLPQLIKFHARKNQEICKTIFSLIKNSKYKVTKTEAKSIVSALQSSKQTKTRQLQTQLLDILFSSEELKPLGIELFTDEFQFIQYLMLKRKQAAKNKTTFAQIQTIVCQCYPKLLEESQRKIQLQEEEGSSWLLRNFDNICNLYTCLLQYLQTTQRPPQITLLWIAFLNNLTTKIKCKTLQEINAKNKIDPNIFESQQAYQQYIEQKEEYMLFRQALMGDYEKTKQLMKKAIEVIMIQKEAQIPAKQLIYEQAMQYVNEILIILGDVDIVSLNKAINFFVENVNESIIYGLGKDNVFSFGRHNFSVENKLILVLTIALKAAQQTPDLYFTKFYQQPAEKQKLRKLIKDYLLKTLKHTMFLPNSTPTIQHITRTTIQLLQNLYNKIFRTNILPTQIFENSSFAAKFKSYQFRSNVKDQVTLFLTQFPYVFSLQQRAWKFRQILRNERYTFRHYGFRQHDDSDEEDWGSKVKIRRNYEFIDAFDQLRKRDLRKTFRITFINQLGFEQKGIDAGGLTKQFLNRVLKDALNPNYGLFIENDVHELLPHPIKAELKQGTETDYYEFIGKLIGLAIFYNITLGYKFSGTFLNAIVGKKNTFDDLKTIDPDLYKSLVYIKDMQEDASQLGLTFLYKDDIRSKNIQLLPNGHLIHVTNENKRLYISLLTAYKVNRLLQHQTRFIRKGLTSTINKEWLFMFNYEELNYIISGQGVIDVDDLRNYTKVTGFNKQESQTMRYFWQVVKEFTEEQKSSLLMFVTACPRPSFLGFKELNPPFTIICLQEKEDMLPISHTCSNVLELPDYNNKELLKKKLLTAIESNAGFEFG